jgi:hypothetical protein
MFVEFRSVLGLVRRFKRTLKPSHKGKPPQTVVRGDTLVNRRGSWGVLPIKPSYISCAWVKILANSVTYPKTAFLDSYIRSDE